ncbi:hypothetical protein ACJIZ3_020348 [Penstemon smallii]|uniref:Uncharacterized protein n=1 Tax=Penstemon smallii TaxID=265156 RepID=A0ABD3SIC4_9LAMI
MATTFSSFRTNSPIVCSSDPPNPNSNSTRSSNWWTPIFGWSSEPNYINGAVKIESGQEGGMSRPDNGSGRVRPEKKLFKGWFTEEKAKELRKKTMETSTFHDIMYHSAIASRLASDVSAHYES